MIFTENNAQFGGAIFDHILGNVTFDDNVRVTFTNNSATDSGGAIHSDDNVKIVSKGNSSVIFDNNYAKQSFVGALSLLNSNYTTKGPVFPRYYCLKIKLLLVVQ